MSKLPLFDTFGLHKHLLRGVSTLGFCESRPIQAKAIPAGLAGRDVLGLAQTGTGKTAAFVLPLLHRMLENDNERQRMSGAPRALVLAPTRELATQIAAEAKTLASFTHLKVITIFGGVSARPQIAALKKKPHLVVGCPGRVLDLLGQGELRLTEIETLVLDEADHMFDMGFLPDIRKIMQTMPDARQNLLFSATMPKAIRHLADDLLKDPWVVELSSSAPVETVEHALYPVNEGRKRALLDRLLDDPACKTAIVFTRTKHRAKRLAQQLDRAGHQAVALQGNMSQGQRDRAMGGFREGRFDILVATDIVARGIDISGVSHVINFDVPTTPEAYTHRIGRTGRAELEGIACTFVTGGDREWVRATEKMIGAKIPRETLEDFDVGDIHEAPPKKAQGQRRGPSGGGRGGRGGAQGRPARSGAGGGSSRGRSRRAGSGGRRGSSGRSSGRAEGDQRSPSRRATTEA